MSSVSLRMQTTEMAPRSRGVECGVRVCVCGARVCARVPSLRCGRAPVGICASALPQSSKSILVKYALGQIKQGTLQHGSLFPGAL